MISRQKSVTYLSPEVSREVPVKKECVTVVDKSTGLKTKVQNQVIMTRREAYKNMQINLEKRLKINENFKIKSELLVILFSYMYK